MPFVPTCPAWLMASFQYCRDPFVFKHETFFRVVTLFSETLATSCKTRELLSTLEVCFEKD